MSRKELLIWNLDGGGGERINEKGYLLLSKKIISSFLYECFKLQKRDKLVFVLREVLITLASNAKVGVTMD